MEEKHPYFGTDGIRGPVGIPPITSEFTWRLGWAVGQSLKEHNRLYPSVLVAKDTRDSSDSLEKYLISGLQQAGVTIIYLGILPTPAIAYLIPYYQADAGIVITASHNPYTDNGFKFLNKQGMKLSATMQQDIESKIKSIAENTIKPKTNKIVQIEPSGLNTYLNFLHTLIPSSFSLIGKKIVLDCAHGATYQIAPAYFKSLGGEVISIAHEPNGKNINLNCGSTHIHYLRAQVIQHQAYLGIAFDGDGDRVIMVDQKGNICDGDDLLFVLAQHLFHTSPLPNKNVVGTIMSNQGLAVALSNLNMQLIRTPVGDSHIYKALNDYQGRLGGEPSGHLIDKHITHTADGIIMALQVLMALNGISLENFRSKLHKYPQYLINLPIKHLSLPKLSTSQFKEVLSTAEKKLASIGGRLVVRPSGTEAILRIMTEGTNEKHIQEIGDQLANRIRQL